MLMLGCQNSPQIIKEPWIEKTVSFWPDFALTNEIVYAVGWGMKQKDNSKPNTRAQISLHTQADLTTHVCRL